jgi:hypothetical protein
MKKQLSFLASLAFLGLALPLPVNAIIIEAQVTSVTGKAYVIQPGSVAKLELRPGMTLAPGSTVSTETGSVGLQLMPGAVTLVEPQTELGINKLDYEKKADNSGQRSVLLDLRKGSVLSNLQKTGTSDFRIKTPYGVAAARGTTWKVDMSKTAVYDGTVDVTFTNGRVVRIQGGTFLGVVSGQPGETAPIKQDEFKEIVEALKEAGFDVNIETLSDGSSNITVVPPGGGQTFRGNYNPANLIGTERSDSQPSNELPLPLDN